MKSRGLLWIVVAGLALVLWVMPLPGAAAVPVDRTFRVEARRFEYQPAVLVVNPGDRVTIELVAGDVVHGISVEGYGVEATADPGQTARLTFVADRQGMFRFRCTVTCGNMHPFMIGKLEVGQNTVLWRVAALMGLGLFAALWRGRR